MKKRNAIPSLPRDTIAKLIRAQQGHLSDAEFLAWAKANNFTDTDLCKGYNRQTGFPK